MTTTPELHERYEIVDRIGDGGAGVVYRVRDLGSSEILALKVLPRAGGAANLRGEFLSLRRLRHDNIVSVHDYGLTRAGHDFFTMDYVAGPPLAEAAADPSGESFYRLIGGVLSGLAFVHARGMVHADIKPSNILVDGSALTSDPARAARLADFGLASALADPTAKAARGTFPYAAPEVWAGRLDARSDLYALGVVLYQLVTGTAPFSAADVRAVLAAQQAGPPPDVRALRPELPRALAELITALLDPAPGARPQTADEVLARINDIGGTDFAVADSRPLVDVGGILVGRDRDLVLLHRQWAQARAGLGSAVLLSGEEGIGKSRLLAELKLKIQLEGGRVYASDAGGAGAPFAGVAPLVRSLLAARKDTGEEAEELRRALAPVLGDRIAPAQIAPESRFGLAEAISSLALEVAADGACAILVDDVQDADPATAELLAYLARSAAGAGLLLVMAGRDAGGPAAESESGGERSAVEEIAAAVVASERGARLDLPPLDRNSVRRLAAEAFGRDIADRLAVDLYRASGGNPAHVARSLELLIAGGAIARGRGKWLLREHRPAIPIPPDALDAARGRFGQLSAATRDVLELAAVLGEAFTRELLIDVAAAEADGGSAGRDLAAGRVDAAIEEAAAAHLVDVDAAAGRCQFSQRGLAAALAAGIAADRRLALHRRAAAALSARAAAGLPVDAAALAAHFLALADRGGAVSWGLRAARERAEVYDHHGALTWYRRVLPELAADSPEAAEVEERIGELCAILGEPVRAKEHYQRAFAAAAERPADRVRLAGLLAELDRQLGHGDDALSRLMEALDLARTHQLREQEAQCHWRIGRVLMYRAEYKAAMEHAVAGHLIAQAGGFRRVSAELEILRADIEIYLGNFDAAVAHSTAGMADAEATGDEILIAHILKDTGNAAFHAGDYARALRVFERAIPANQRVGRIEQVARSLNNLGAAHYCVGNWRATREAWERFRRLCERLGERSELGGALNNLGMLYRDTGELDRALAALERGAEVAAEIGHAHTGAMILGNRGEVLYRRGDLAGARDCYQRALAEFERIDAREYVIENRRRLCEVDIAAGRLTQAVERAIDTARAAKRAGAKLEEAILHRVAATALRLQGDLDAATWFCERAGEMLASLGTPFERARVDVEAAEIAAERGDLERAGTLLSGAIEVFADLGARWDLSRARARQRALAPAAPALRSAPGEFDLLLELSRATAHLELDRLLERALDKLLALSRFDRGFILLLDEDGRPRERMRRVGPGSRAFARDEAEFSGSIVRKVAATGEAVAFTDIAHEDELRQQKSVVALGLRQVLCAPLRAHGRVIGIAYIDSTRLSIERGGVDLALFEAFASQLALAVDNARLREEERRKTELMAILAHEIRNPLGGILGYSEIGRSEGDIDAPDLFTRIHRDAERLRRLVDNVLELTRHEAGKVDWSIGPLSVERLVGDVVSSYAPQCLRQDIAITADVDDAGLQALGNPDRIMQVLSNLVSNAVKFTPEGGTIRVAARRERVVASDPDSPPAPATELGAWAPLDPDDDTSRDFVRVDVIDSGPGMSEEVRARLFRKFAQGRRKGGSGVGLGLYISREIIQRHGGTIWVTSEPGRGSTFSFRIPSAYGS